MITIKVIIKNEKEKKDCYLEMEIIRMENSYIKSLRFEIEKISYNK